MTEDTKKIALVTGASRGIGRAIAIALGGVKCHVLINYLSSHDAAQETLKLLEQVGGTGELWPFDVSNSEASRAAVASILEKFKRLDILVNNAGIRKDMLMVWMKQDDWQSVMRTNLDSFYNVTQPVIKEMLLKRSGRIINIASTAGQTGNPGQVNYSAAKAGLIGATTALAKEIAKRGITVNAVAPGFIETEMLEGLPLEEIKKMIPMQRFGKAEDVAAVVRFLCEPEAAYITGQVIGVNGGIC